MDTADISIAVPDAGVMCTKLSVVPLKFGHGMSRVTVVQFVATGAVDGDTVAPWEANSDEVPVLGILMFINVTPSTRTSIRDRAPVVKSRLGFMLNCSRSTLGVPALPQAYLRLGICTGGSMYSHLHAVGLNIMRGDAYHRSAFWKSPARGSLHNKGHTVWLRNACTLSASLYRLKPLNRYHVPGVVDHPAIVAEVPPLTTSWLLVQARQHVAALHVLPGVHVRVKLSRWLGTGQVTFWLPHVAGVPTHTPPKHRSLNVLASKSVHVVPFAEHKEMRASYQNKMCGTRFRHSCYPELCYMRRVAPDA
jgi:hypothetical protein